MHDISLICAIYKLPNVLRNAEYIVFVGSGCLGSGHTTPLFGLYVLSALDYYSVLFLCCAICEIYDDFLYIKFNHFNHRTKLISFWYGWALEKSWLIYTRYSKSTARIPFIQQCRLLPRTYRPLEIIDRIINSLII